MDIAKVRGNAIAILACAVTCIGCGAAGDLPDAAEAGEAERSWRLDTIPALSSGRGPEYGEPEFFQISVVRLLTDETVLVADGGPRMLRLDRDGNMLDGVGRAGDGPGEYRAVAWVREQSTGALAVYDPVVGRLSWYGVNGEYERAVSPVAPDGAIDPQLLGLFPDGTMLGRWRQLAPPPPGGSGRVRPNLVLARFAPDGALVDTVAEMPGDEVGIVEGIIVNVPIATRTLFAVGADAFFAAHTDEFAVQAFSRQGREVVIPGNDRPRTPLTEGRRAELGLSGRLASVAPAFLPAIDDLLLDDSGMLWVRSFETVADRATWSVFSADGRIAGELSAPAAFRPFHISEDEMAGVWTDDLGVEHVRLYHFTRGLERR